MNSETSANNIIQKGPIAWMAGHSVAANLLMLIFLIGGFFAAIQIKQEVHGKFEMDWVSVSVSYPGASPEEVENGIVLAIEEAVQSIDGVKKISSTANEGSGSVMVETLSGTDLQKITQDIKSEVERISSFPQEAEDPQISVISGRRQVLSLVLYGNVDDKILRDSGESIRDRLLSDPDIIQVDLSGVKKYEISIEVSQENLRTYNLTIEDIANKIKMATVEMPGGSLKTSGGEILVRMVERNEYGDDFAQIPIITSKEGTSVKLGDIAQIGDGFEETDHMASYNGKNSLMIDVYRIGDQSPTDVSKAVMRNLDEVRASLPPGLSIDVQDDMAEAYGQRLDLLLGNAYIGLILVFVLLGLFLEPRLAFWVTMGIPISFLGSFLILPRAGVTLNMNSMFAFIVALGIVVDDAIVVGENVYKYRSQGYSPLQAAIKGAKEVSMPVTFSILTNITTFVPLLFVPGPMGMMFAAIPVVVISVFSISLVESLFILPAHLGHLSEKGFGGPMKFFFALQQWISNALTRLIEMIYTPILSFSLRSRYIVLSSAIAIMLITLAYVASGRMGMSMMEATESDFAQATGTLPYGTAVEKTEKVESILVKAAQKVIAENGGDKLSKGIYSEVGVSAGFGGGSQGGHTTQVRVFLHPEGVRPISTEKFVELWRKETGDIIGLDSLIYKSDAMGPGSGSALTIELSHRNTDILMTAGAELAEAISAYPMARDIDDGFQPGKQQVDFSIRPEGRILGLTAQSVASQVRHAFYGVDILKQQRGRNEVTVVARLPKEERISEYNLEELMIRTPDGKDVPLREVVDIKRGRAYTSIRREDGRRVISVTADINPRPMANMINNALNADAIPKLKQKYPGLEAGAGGFQESMQESMTSLFMGLGLAMLVVYSLLAIPFRSYIQPLIIMSSVPFGIIGAIMGHIIMGYSLSLMSLFGIVALTGVVVNGALVLVNFTNREMENGLSAHDALVAAGIRRFRPIMLTALTTFGALIPMIFETSMQAKFMIPMAISLGFGVMFATLITLILVPSIYLIIEDLRGLFGTKQATAIDMTSPAGEVGK